MKTRNPGSMRKVIYASWVFVVLFGLLPTLTPPATPLIALTGAEHGASPTSIRATGSQEVGEPDESTQEWGTSPLSWFMQTFRIRHPGVSPLQNVAAIRVKTSDQDVVVVAASAGEQANNRDAVVELYQRVNGKYKLLKSVDRGDLIVNANLKVNKRPKDLHADGEFLTDVWDSERLLADFLDSGLFAIITGIEINNLDAKTTWIWVETELPMCGMCNPLIFAKFRELDEIGHLHIAHNFDLDSARREQHLQDVTDNFIEQEMRIFSEEAEAYKKAATWEERQKIIEEADAALRKELDKYENRTVSARSEAQSAANSGPKATTIKKWERNGKPITAPEVSELPSGTEQQESAKSQQEQSRILGLPSPCGGTSESLDKSGGHDGQPTAMMALTSAASCPEGEGTPGGLAKALESANLGGVDFSTLDMRYMSDDPDSGGLQYSFSGKLATSGLHQDTTSGLSAVTNSAADLRTWLVLSPDKFWVNLNPTEPNRIVDPKVGQTNAGKAMLDADLQMKTTSAKLLDPHTKLGAQYWKALAGSSSQACYESRMWIVPGNVEVHQDGGSLYILKAQLAVKAVPEHVTSSQSCHYTQETDARGQRLDDTLIVPRVAKAVNTAPEYAPIRRAFMARVVAQWIRDRHASGQRTSFDSLIDSGNIGPAKLTNGWQPRQVFNDFVHLFKDGAFTYTTTVHEGRTIATQKITVGGVDFTKLDPTKVSAAQMNKQDPYLPQTAKASATNLAGAPDGSMWLGDTLPTPRLSLWTRITDPIRVFLSGRAGLATLLLVALGVITFGIRRGSKRRRQTA